MKFAWNTIRGRLLLALVLTNVPLLAIGVYLAVDRAVEERRQAESRLRSEVLVAARALGEAMSGVRQFLYAVANSPAVKSKDSAHCIQYARDLLPQLTERYTNIWALDADGRTFCSVLAYNPDQRFTDRKWFLDARRKGTFAL